MAQYGNLKDYFIGEHIELIKGAIIEHLEHELNNGFYINNPIVKSLVCTNDDAQFNVEYELGISTDITIDHITDSRSFILTLTGNLEKKLNDIKVAGVKDISESDFPSDNLLSQFILHDIPISELERIGNEMFAKYKELGMTDGCHLSVDRLIEQESFFYSPLPDNCLGRIILTETDVEVFYRENDEQIKCKNHSAIPGTILLNKKKYFDAYDGSWTITIAHELVHWWFHTRFFKVLTLLGQTHVDLNSSADTVTFNDSMTDVQKALCIAEWQADALAMRLAIPQSTVDTMIERIANDPSTHYENLGDRMQACVNKFAKLYNVSPYVVKERLRQLGYDFVDGTCIEYEENGIKVRPAPFYFYPGTLKDNETFVIYRDNYERLLKENKEFAELIENRHFVYTGYVICINSTKYISPVYTDRGLSFELTDYAREHANECCLKFTYCKKHSITTNKVFDYLCKLDDEKYSKGDELTQDAINDYNSHSKMQEEIKEAKRILAEMEQKGIISFKDALRFHIKRLGLHRKDIWDQIYLGESTFKSYCDRGSEPSLENALIICNKLSLPYLLSINLLERAHITLNTAEKRDQMYDYLLTITNATLDEWELFLTKYGFPSLVTQSN